MQLTRHNNKNSNRITAHNTIFSLAFPTFFSTLEMKVFLLFMTIHMTDIWVYRVGLWVFLLVIEMFVMSFDFLAIGIAALVTAWFSYMLGMWVDQWQLSAGIFVIASVVAIMITRLLVMPSLTWDNDTPSPMSGDSIVGKEFMLHRVNDRLVVKYEGVYRNTTCMSPDACVAGERVVVTGVDDNRAVIRLKS